VAISLTSFLDEMEKIAFNETQAAKVMGLAKRIQLPKASKAVRSSLSGSPGFKSLTGDALGAAKKLGANTPELKSQVHEAISSSPGSAITKQVGKTIFPGHTGHVAKLVGAKGLDGKQQKMLHGVLKGHELDEATVKGGLGAAHLGHRSPDVIFREHNRLATMPKGYEPVRKSMQSAREGRESTFLFPKGTTYGEGPRFSRHARKRLGELAEKKTISAYQAATGAEG